MPITKSNYGIHDDVHVMEFGTGDIMFTKCKEDGFENDNILVFSNHGPKEIGSTTSEFVGKSTDELPEIKVIMRFLKPESITALIHSLTELQESVFKNKQ